MSNVIQLKKYQPSALAKRCRDQLSIIDKPITYGAIDLSAYTQDEVAKSAIWAASPLVDAVIQIRNLAITGIKPDTSRADQIRILEIIRGLAIDAHFEHETRIDILEDENTNNTI